MSSKSFMNGVLLWSYMRQILQNLFCFSVVVIAGYVGPVCMSIFSCSSWQFSQLSLNFLRSLKVRGYNVFWKNHSPGLKRQRNEIHMVSGHDWANGRFFSRFKRDQGHIPKKKIETSRCQNTVAALFVGLRYRIMKLLPLHFSTFTYGKTLHTMQQLLDSHSSRAYSRSVRTRCTVENFRKHGHISYVFETTL